jgi:hypothetical protein
MTDAAVVAANRESLVDQFDPDLVDAVASMSPRSAARKQQTEAAVAASPDLGINVDAYGPSVEDKKFIRTMEEAETKRTSAIHCKALSEDELSFFEEELRKLIVGLQSHTSNKKIKKSSAGYKNLVKLTTAWPRLRATCQVADVNSKGEADSFTVIPRALQAEEDLVKLIRDFDDAMATADHLSVFD